MYIIIILSLIPVAIWSLMAPISSRFVDIGTIFTSLGQICGLVGMMLFSINLILAGRFKFFDKMFKGLDKVYANHSRIGAIAFSLMLFHPLMLVVKYVMISTQSAALFFVPFVNMQITWGIISLLLFIILISFTFYIKLKYNTWKFSHKFMTLAFIFAVIHTSVINSDVSRNPILRFYILGFAVVAIFVVVRKFFFGYILNKKIEYKIKKIRQLNIDIVEIEMVPVDKPIKFKSGQFAFFTFKNELMSKEPHPFSISSGSSELTLKITVKNLGDFTSKLNNLKEGDNVLVDGPYGHFSYNNVKSKKQIWIAGGIGITPFFSMAKSIDQSYDINFFYSVKEESEAVYTKDLLEIVKNNPNFKFNLWSVRDRGYIEANIILRSVGDLGDVDLLFCGPPVFMKSLNDQFLKLGVNKNRIHYENFSFFD